MIKNFVTTTIRHITRNKFYTSLNIIGLSIGLVCTILIVLFIKDELSYDRYNENHKKIVRLATDITINGKRDRVATSSMPIGPVFCESYKEIEDFVRFRGLGQQLFKYKGREFHIEGLAYADSSVFKIFSFELIEGSRSESLTQPYSIVINENLAKMIFGDDSALGKKIMVGDGVSYTITGVMKDMPVNSHLQFSGFYSMNTLEDLKGKEEFNSTRDVAFWNFSNQTFLLLRDGVRKDFILDAFPGLYDKYMRKLGDRLGCDFKLVVQNLAEIHLRSDLDWDAPTGDIKYILALASIAIFILSIASINYMNMATARSAKRAKEVGIRKVVGAFRENLVKQFLMESVSLTVIAYLIALILVELLLPSFNILVGKELSLSFRQSIDVISISFGIAILLGAVSGIYPSIFLSSFQPVIILKGRVSPQNESSVLRKFLVISQFAISAIMISGTLIVASQLFYMNNKDMGFNKEDILVSVMRDSTLRANVPYLKRELQKNANVKNVASSSMLIGFGGSKSVHSYESESGMNEYVLNFNMVDYEYIDLMEIKMFQGRKFSSKMDDSGTGAFIVNQSAVEIFNWGVDAVGKKMEFGVEIEGEEDDVLKGNVVGVIQDYHFQPLQNDIEPINLILNTETKNRKYLHVKLNSENREETIEYIKSVWDKYSPNWSFTYFFLDERMKNNYESERRLTWIFSIFSLISILIASLGLFGVSSFMAEQRSKEIGIRKVVGASVSKLVYMLTREFLRLIIIANILAIPFVYWVASKWLSDFTYHITVELWMFLSTVAISLLIGLGTVSWLSFKLASSDPVKVIRYE
jgi:putative ABC transport system permease protein